MRIRLPSMDLSGYHNSNNRAVGKLNRMDSFADSGFYLMVVVRVARVQERSDAMLHGEERSFQGVELVTRYNPAQGE